MGIARCAESGHLFVSEGTLSPGSGRTPTGTQGASGLAIDLPHRLAGRARTASGHTRIPGGSITDHITGGPALRSPMPLNAAAPPRRECARRGLDPVPPPNREDRTMIETVDQAQAQPPRALAGITGDATSLSLASTSHFGGSRGGRLPHGHAVLRQSSHISTGCPCTTSVDITRGTPGSMTLAVLRPSS